jgi:hypothetical protein
MAVDVLLPNPTIGEYVPVKPVNAAPPPCNEPFL